jgi:hypothetical protein
MLSDLSENELAIVGRCRRANAAAILSKPWGIIARGQGVDRRMSARVAAHESIEHRRPQETEWRASGTS